MSLLCVGGKGGGERGIGSYVLTRLAVSLNCSSVSVSCSYDIVHVLTANWGFTRGSNDRNI